MRKDIFGFPVEIGDIVAYNPPKYKGMVIGEIIGFTPQMIKVRNFHNDNTSNVYEVALELTGIYDNKQVLEPNIKEVIREQLGILYPEYYI